jgi:hypothetical protein
MRVSRIGRSQPSGSASATRAKVAREHHRRQDGEPHAVAVAVAVARTGRHPLAHVHGGEHDAAEHDSGPQGLGPGERVAEQDHRQHHDDRPIGRGDETHDRERAQLERPVEGEVGAGPDRAERRHRHPLAAAQLWDVAEGDRQGSEHDDRGALNHDGDGDERSAPCE